MHDISITDENFEDKVLQDKGIVLVDFWAPWCGPCQMLGPIIEELAKEMKDGVNIYKLDVDANPQTAERYGIMSVPTIIIFKDGKKIEQATGMQSKETLREKIESALKTSPEAKK